MGDGCSAAGQMDAVRLRDEIALISPGKSSVMERRRQKSQRGKNR